MISSWYDYCKYNDFMICNITGLECLRGKALNSALTLKEAKLWPMKRQGPQLRPDIKGGEIVAHEAVFGYCKWATMKPML
jgi:hypothetical protein